MKGILCLLLVCFACSTAKISHSQVIPESQRVDWSQCGFIGDIPNPVNIVDVTTFGAVGDGVTNNYTPILNAINSLGGHLGVIYFPAGTFLVTTQGFLLPDSVILRGSGYTTTNIKFNFSGANAMCLAIHGTVPTAYVSILSGFTKGSTRITVSDASGFSPGNWVEIREDNGSWDTNPAAWAEHAVGQVVMVTGKSGDTLFLERPLRINYDASLFPEIGKFTPRKYVGIESMTIEKADDATTGGPTKINFELAVNCWIRGIESNKSVGSHIYIRRCSNIEITGSYFHHAFTYTGSSNRGYGITLANHASDCLIANNIFKHLRHAMMTKVGANANVFAYNYSLDVYRSEYPNNYGGDISLHGHYSYANLFEGNIVQNIIIDHEWGPSGPYNTFFRNRAESFGIIMTTNSVTSDYQNFVGNEVTNTGPFMGLYTLTGTGHFQFGNNIKGTITPGGTNNLPDSSYYLQDKPDFWSVNYLWPSIGIPNTLNSGTVQAKMRYSNSHYTYVIPLVTAGSDVTINPGDSVTLQGTVTYGIGPYDYQWQPTTGLSNPDILSPVASPPYTTTYILVVTDSYGCVDSDEVTVFVNTIPGITLDIKVYLEGPFNGTDMDTGLQPFVPLSQPYNASPWNYPGAESVLALPNTDIVDWLLVELRETAGGASTATPDKMIARQAAFLLRNGKIVSTDGSSMLDFSLVVINNLYAVLWHRNHLGVMSATPLTNVDAPFTYDFSTAAGKAYGGMNGHKEIAPGIWGMIGGDGNASGNIENLDKNDIWKPQSGTQGYKQGDYDLNSNVNNADKVDVWTPNSGKGCQVPD